MRTTYFHLAATILLCLSFFSLHAKIWRVNNNSNYSVASQLYGDDQGGTAAFPVFKEIDQAIDYNGVVSGDTIYVEASSNQYNAFTLASTDPQLVIFGEGYFTDENPQVSATGLSTKVASFNISRDGCIVAGIRFNSSATSYIIASNVLIERCYFTGTLFLQSATNPIPQNITIRRNYLNSSSSISSTSSNSGLPSNVAISNNIIRGSVSINNAIGILAFDNNVLDPASTNVTYSMTCGAFRNNIIRNTNVTMTITCQNITHNIVSLAVPSWTDPSNQVVPNQATTVFVPAANNTTDGDFQLLPAYTAGNYGSDGTQRGAFGGQSPYSLSGVGPIPIVYSILQTTGQATPSGLNVTFSTRTAE